MQDIVDRVIVILPLVMIMRLVNTAVIQFNLPDAAQGLSFALVAALFVQYIWHAPLIRNS